MPRETKSNIIQLNGERAMPTTEHMLLFSFGGKVLRPLPNGFPHAQFVSLTISYLRKSTF
jgi:hypothetical protein